MATMNDAWNLYEASAAKVAGSLGHKHRRVGMIKLELTLLLEIGNRFDEILDVIDEVLEIHRSQTVSEDNKKTRLEDIMYEMHLINRKAEIYLGAKQDLAAAQALQDDMIECVGKMEQMGGKDNAPMMLKTLENYRNYCVNVDISTVPVDGMIKAFHAVTKVYDYYDISSFAEVEKDMEDIKKEDAEEEEKK